MNERTDNNEDYEFANIPTNKKSMQRICLGSKQWVMRNIPLPKIQYDNNLSVIAPNEPVKNSLTLGIKVKPSRARHVDDDIIKLNHNIISNGRGLMVDIKDLLTSTRDLTKIFTHWFVKNSGMDLLHAQV